MNLPPIECPDRYRGLFVIDFGSTCSLGYTAEEVARLMESEACAGAKVYRIHGARPDGTLELIGVPRSRFELEAGLVFYRREMPAAREDHRRLIELAEEAPPPCRAQWLLGGFPEASAGAGDRRHGFATALAYPAESDPDVAAWVLEIGFEGGELAAGGVDALTALRRELTVVDSVQLRPAAVRTARPLDELLESLDRPIQRVA
jgi:hypothetical protein